jgi:hypothetical protein
MEDRRILHEYSSVVCYLDLISLKEAPFQGLDLRAADFPSETGPLPVHIMEVRVSVLDCEIVIRKDFRGYITLLYLTVYIQYIGSYIV